MVFKDLEIAPKFKMLDGTYSEKCLKFIWEDSYKNPAAMVLYYDILHSMSPAERKNGYCVRQVDEFEAYRIYDTFEDLREYITIIFGKKADGKCEIMISFPYETFGAIRFANDK